ncbi:carbohydrate-binding protein [Brachybacterium vulturis]|uniref:Carbohydrate-binding protein n=1 Tax=Brachybacterium vulturis TaxID=2017484 RepID=A0A291GIV8_9MICO|nr:endo-alpha-N-acetylgalactosaminidase family protein [Brachybacterium vulturis]ATG50463.1 carbohydrate-binding protein [Brachybacterium vulturis]
MDRRMFLLTSGVAAGVTALAGPQAALAAPDGAEPGPIIAEAPEDALVITDGTLQVRLHPEFPQVVDYRLDGAQLAGRLGDAHRSVIVDEVERDVEVSAPELTDDSSATYHLSIPDLPGVEFDAVLSVEDGVFTWRLTEIADPDGHMHRLRVPRLDLTTVDGGQSGAQVVAANLSVDRDRSGDTFFDLASQEEDVTALTHVALIVGSELAAGFETNAVEDNTAGGETAERVRTDNSRYIVTVATEERATIGTVSPGTFVVRGSTAELGLGPDEDPYVKVRPVADINDDGAVTWQDAAIAARDIAEPVTGSESVPQEVIKRIPFNIVSQATHPFLRTLDDTKRIALATDGLGQSVMLKGYQAEGHDSAHPDYAGHYNHRAGGKTDLTTLVTEGETWNATFGVHVNATEAYSEAHAFSEDLLRDPIQPGWGWMNQAYMIDGPKDLGTAEVLRRFQEFRDEISENLSFLYVDVYYPSGWEGQRLSRELEKQGWAISTEWANKMPRSSLWSHWAADENYGGSSNKGLNSQVIRFIDNSRKDVWNPDPLLSNANVQEFEGWTGHQDANAFFATVWARNVPTKFLQRSPIVSWSAAGEQGPGRIVLADGTEVISDVESVGGEEIPTDRTITTDGATVYEGGKYLLPWADGSEKLYHWNPDGGSSTWTLTDAWSDHRSLTMFRLTDSGRTDEVTVPVRGGEVTLEAKAGSAYVLFPPQGVPEQADPRWGFGTPVADPGFFSGTLDAWKAKGEVSVETDEHLNRQVLFGDGRSFIEQKLRDPARAHRHLPAGTWSAWAWVEIDPRSTREVTVSATGPHVEALGFQAAVKRGVATTVTASTVINATASDTKHGRHFQRVRVTFTSDGTPVTFRVEAGEGEAEVRVDDVRVVPFTAPVDPEPTAETVLFEDFENVDIGYWPFVTGAGNSGGDARTQLAERHQPFSQAGWYGVNQEGEAVEGGKLTDNVLRGTWSLMCNEERVGLVLSTTGSSLPLTPGHRYRLTLDHQTAFADTYQLVVGEDTVGDPVASTRVGAKPFPQARATERISLEFTASEKADTTWIGVEKLGGGRQANLTIDDLRLEDLGTVD